MNGYDLTRQWYNFKFENPEKVKAIHSDCYFYIVDLWNRLGQKEKIGLPTYITMENLGIGSRNTYYKIIKELSDFGFIKIISESKNQHQSRVIALSKIEQASSQALEQAHKQASSQALEQTPEHIIEQRNNRTIEQINKEREKRFSPPSLLEVQSFIVEKKYGVNAHSFWNFYESKNWMVGKNKMKDWKKAVSGWESRNKENNSYGKQINNPGGANTSTGYKPASVDSEKLFREFTDDFENGNIPGQY